MRPLRLINHTPQGVVLTDAAASVVGSVIDERMIVDARQTVLDPEIEENGGWIEFPVPLLNYAGRAVTKVYYPAFRSERKGRLIHLHPMAVAGGMLLRMCLGVQEGTMTIPVLQRAFLAYQYFAIRQLGGKNGIVNSNLIAGRISRSGRAVLLINGDHAPDWVSLPPTIMGRLELKHGDLVIVGREPTIWHGSLEILRARVGDSNCIEMHPLLFDQLGGDCDGDTVYVYRIPDDPDCIEEAARNVLGFTKSFATWSSTMRHQNPDPTVDWSRVVEETRERSVMTGMSISPRDILNQSPVLEALCKTMKKDVAVECRKIALGISPEELKKYILEQNQALLYMKVWMGPIGAASNRLRVFAGMDPEMIASASYVSERLQQMLLDTKHHIGTGKGSYSVNTVLDILNRRGVYARAMLFDVIEEMRLMGMDPEKIWPILAKLWITYPLSCAVKSLFSNAPESRLNRMLGYIRGFIYDKDIELLIKKILSGSRSFGDVTRENLVRVYEENTAGLNDICTRDFPTLDLISDRTINNREKAQKIARSIFVEGRTDTSGVNKIILDEALKGVTCSAPKS